MSFDHFFTYDELTGCLNEAHEAYPDLTDLDSIGKSYEGRDIWILTMTNQQTGRAEDKPAMYIDGNIHAGEVTGSAVCLYTIQYLLNNYGEDDLVTHLLDTRTFYILPRVNPDGAEVYLTSPDTLRSSVRPNPDFELKDNHLYREDVNGDGRILTMRMEDPAGAHKASEEDPRVMVPRGPDDFEGTYYSLYPEGTVHNYDGGPIKIGPPRWHLDINRNFPADWSPTQSGAGEYPLSEPETRAMVNFILEHENIATLQAYHTFAGIILRPSCTKPDSEISRADLKAFESVGKMGTELTDYPVRSVYHGFTRDRGTPRHGVFIDWVYEHMGILGYTTELWDKYARAGIDREDRTFGKPVDEKQALRLMRWHDEEELGAFVDWEPFDHPQLGRVEIGGYCLKTFQQNANFKFLEDECHKNAVFSLKQAAAAPRVSIENTEVRHLSGGLAKVVVDIKNEGYLPTNVTRRALEADAVDPITATISGAEVLEGEEKVEVDHLDGYIKVAEGMGRTLNCRERLTWLVNPDGASCVEITVDARRAGTAKITLDL